MIEDVVQMRGEGGVLYLNSYNETAIRKVITDNNLVFHSLFTVEPHGFLGASNPLSTQSSVTLEDLTGLPRLSYEQGEHNAFYYSEEPLSTLESAQDIRVRNRATLFNLLVGLNGYTICMGLINKELNGPTS